jgi:hypothetical protein
VRKYRKYIHTIYQLLCDKPFYEQLSKVSAHVNLLAYMRPIQTKTKLAEELLIHFTQFRTMSKAVH